MTKMDDDFQSRKRELLRKNKETADHMVDMVTDMATNDALKLIHAIFEVLRRTEVLGGADHKLNTKYTKEVVNLIYSYQNRYLATFLIVAGQEIRGIERQAEYVEKQGIREQYSILKEFTKEGKKFLEELLRQQQEQYKKKNSKERLDPRKQEDAGEENKI